MAVSKEKGCMDCPKCAFEDTKVISTSSSTIKERTRKCPVCGYVFATVELPKVDTYLEDYARELLKGDKKLMEAIGGKQKDRERGIL